MVGQWAEPLEPLPPPPGAAARQSLAEVVPFGATQVASRLVAPGLVELVAATPAAPAPTKVGPLVRPCETVSTIWTIRRTLKGT